MYKPATWLEENAKELGIDFRYLGTNYAQLRLATPENTTMISGDDICIAPNESYSFRTLENIYVPQNTTAIISLRYEYARLGIMMCPFFLDSEFEGQVEFFVYNGGADVVRIPKQAKVLKLYFV